jgi:hypothetical protein
MLSAYPSQEGNKHADRWFESAVAERIGDLLVIKHNAGRHLSLVLATADSPTPISHRLSV